MTHFQDKGVTVCWCTQCNRPAVVVEAGIETTAWPAPERDYWVRRLDCGHDEVTER